MGSLIVLFIQRRGAAMCRARASGVIPREPRALMDATQSRLGVAVDQIAEFGRRWKVSEFARVGSAVRDDFRDVVKRPAVLVRTSARLIHRFRGARSSPSRTS